MLGKPLSVIVAAALFVFFVVYYFELYDPQDPSGFVRRQTFPVGTLLIGVSLWLGWFPLYQYWYWKRYFYDIDGENLYIRKGVIVTKEAILPFSRITDVYLDQDILDVCLGLYDLHFSTPTIESGKFAHIDGLSRDDAQQLKRLLIEKVNAAPVNLPKGVEEELEYDSELDELFGANA